MNGQFVEYYETGQVKAIGKMLNNKREGEYKEFHPTGDLKSKATYSKGVLTDSSQSDNITE